MTLVLADAGTPLVWGSMFHLVFGNFLVGVYEAWILVRFFGCSPRRAGAWMILANYLSCAGGAGLLFIAPTFSLTSARGALALLWLASAVATYFLELPFCWAALGKVPDRLRKALRANLVVQAASYVPLTLFCLGASQTGLLWNARLHRDTRFAADAPWRVYSISPEDHRLHSIRLDGSQSRMEATEPQPEDVTLVLSSGQNGTWSVARFTDAEMTKRNRAQSETEEDAIVPLLVLATSVQRESLSWALAVEGPYGGSYQRLDFRPSSAREPSVFAPPWGWGVLEIGGRNLSFETLPRALWINRIVLLPGDLGVLESRGEILVFNTKTLDFGHLTNGTSPIVLPENPVAP